MSAFSLSLCLFSAILIPYRRRIFLTDTNQDLLIALRQEGWDHRDLSLGSRFNLHWPQTILFSQSLPPVTGEEQAVELYFSEYLGILHRYYQCLIFLMDSGTGRIWKVMIHLEVSSGDVDYRYSTSLFDCSWLIVFSLL